MEELDKKNPFKTPEDYFEGFTDGLLDKLGKETSDLPEEDGFTVPENYFDGVHNRILEKLEKKETKVVQLNPYKKYYLAAASVAAVFIITLVSQINVQEDATYDTLVSADIEDYFDNYVYDFSEDELAELLSMQEVGVNDVLNIEINQEEIVDYLDTTIEDLHELNNIYNEE